MSATEIPPLVVEFEVTAAPAHAFATWVDRIELWWPKDHTVGTDPAAIVFESHVGGRIYERDDDGREVVWGEVTHWEPPSRIDFRWHLFFSPDEATTVSVTFEPTGTTTLVRLVQTGWDALGEQAQERRTGTQRGWTHTTSIYRDFINQEATP